MDIWDGSYPLELQRAGTAVAYKGGEIRAANGTVVGFRP